jgi:hypothetical protein
MHRSPGAAFVVLLAALQPIAAASQAADRFRVATSPAADVHQEMLQAVDPESKQATEVFPGSYVSPYGAAIVKSVSNVIARVDEFDRSTLVAEKIGVGFDRSLIGWRADPTGQRVALAVRYHRDRLLALDIKFSNDYGGPEPPDPADYEALTVAVCDRGAARSWTCREEELAAAAKKHNLSLPKDRANQEPVVNQLLQLALAGK